MHDPAPPEDASRLIAEHDRVRHRRHRRQVMAGVAVVVVAGAGTGAWWATRSSASTAAGLTTTSRVVTATTGTMETTVAASGTLEPEADADLAFDVSGQVTAVEVTAGQKVVAGQVLATVDPTGLQEELDQAEQTLTSAQAALTTAEDDDDLASVLDQDRTAVVDDTSALATARTAVADADLRSTITGEVSSVGLAVGDEVSASGSSNGSSGSGGGGEATEADSSGSSSTSDDIDVVSTDRYTVSATVDDTEVSSVKVGQAVTVTPSESSTTVTGRVTSVGLVASTSSGVSDFPVEITVEGRQPTLYAGDSVTASIIVAEEKNVVEIPTAAISYQGGEATVTVSEQGRRKAQSITTGATEGDETEVTSGLRSGAQLVEEIVTVSGGGSARSIFGGTGRSGRFPGGFSGHGFPGGSSEGGFPGGSSGGGFGGGGTSGSGGPTGG